MSCGLSRVYPWFYVVWMDCALSRACTAYNRRKTSPHKQSHPFRNSSLVSLHTLPLEKNLFPSSFAFPLAHSSKPARELHSRVYHCPDNNDLPTRELLRVGVSGGQEGASRGVWPERRDEASRMAGPPRDGQPPCIREYFTLTALRGIGWPRPETLHRFGIMDLYITYSS